MYKLIQNESGFVIEHAVGSKVSKLVDLYYSRLRHEGFMQVVDQNGKALASMGSKGVNHYAK